MNVGKWGFQPIILREKTGRRSLSAARPSGEQPRRQAREAHLSERAAHLSERVAHPAGKQACRLGPAKPRSGPVLSILAAILIIVSSCQAPFFLQELVDGPDGTALTISPAATELQVNDSLPVAASGGLPPYTYKVVSGAGSFSGNLYTAPAAPGTEIIQVSDSAGNTVKGTYTINSAGLSLGITPSSQTVYTGGSITFSPIGGTSPYSYEVSTNNSGAPPMSGSLYTAGSSAGTDVVTITDSAAPTPDTANAVITVQAKPLAVSPQTITVYVNQSVQFSAVGGDGPFSYEIVANGSGAPPMSGSTYTAGPAPGTDMVELKDTYDGRTRNAAVTVVDTASTVDYEVTTIIDIVPVDFLTRENFDAEFSIINNGSTAGSRTISWTVYASMDTSIGGTDDRIAASSSLAGTSAGSTTQVSFTGTWPGEAGSYYLLVDVTAADDLETADNRNRSASTTQIYAPLSIIPAAASVYTGQSVELTVSGGTGDYTYGYAQVGSGSPSMVDDLYTAGANEGTDILQATDDNFPGWSPASTTITVTAAPPPPQQDIEYAVSGFTAIDTAPDTGTSIGESFTLQNYGPADGAASVNYSVYLSQDSSDSLSAGDVLIDSGYIAALEGDDGSAGGSDEATVSIDGEWPENAGTWYLKVLEWADDEMSKNEWFVSGAFSVQSVSLDVDYYVSSPPAGGVGADLGDPVSEVSATFTVTNQGADDGTSTVYWTAYISDDEVYNLGDDQIDSGSFGGLEDGDSHGPVSIDDGTWEEAGSKYLLVRLQAADEVNTANNIRASSDVYVVTDTGATEPDYTVSSISMYSPFVTAGSAVEETFTIGNIGTNGSQNITWKAYASIDSVPEGGEEIGSGVVGPLSAGQTLTDIPTLGAVWPASPGDYYLIIEETAPDESDQGDYAVSAGKFTVSEPPDYIIETVTYPGEAEQSTPISGGFTVRNSGSGDGKKNVQWEVYTSYDTGFSADDQLLGSGSFSAMAAAGTRAIQPSDLTLTDWPFYGLCYILIRVEADDDGDLSNNEYITASTKLYILDSEGPDNAGPSNDGSGSNNGPIANTQDIGELHLGQTLVIRGWLDNSSSGKYDTYAFDLQNGVATVSTYAAWTEDDDIGALYVWDEYNHQFASTDNSHYREPAAGDFSVTGWIPPETGYVGISSYEYVPPTEPDKFPYTIYISGED